MSENIGEDAYRYLSDKQLAARYGVSRATVWRWVRKGTLPEPKRINGATRWWLPDLIEHEAGQGLYKGRPA